jgi:hypothetical protein
MRKRSSLSERIYRVRKIGAVNGTVYLKGINKLYTAFYTFCAIWIQFDIKVLLAVLLNVYKDREKRCSERHSLPTDVKKKSPIS